MAGFHQFVKAYRKDNHDYTFWQDDGTKVTLIAREDGVTEEWIAWLKAEHREERRIMRHGEDQVTSLEAYCETLDDHSEVFVDLSGDPERLALERLEQEASCERLRRGLDILSPEQRTLLARITKQEETFASIAREEGVNESTIRRRLRKVLKQAGWISE